MDKNTTKMLKLDAIMALIEPAGDCGKHYRQHLQSYKPGQESQCNMEFNRLSALQHAIQKDNLPAEKLHGILSHLAWLPQIIKALDSRPLLLHELFEIKQFIHYTLQLCELLHSYGLQKHYTLPNFNAVYQLLDAEGQNTPAFHLSPQYHKDLAKYMESMQLLQRQKRQLTRTLALEAQNELQLTAPKTELVVSRMETERVKQLEKSRYYRLLEENYVNLTFILQETPQLKQLTQRLAALSLKLQAAEQAALQKLSEKLAPHSAKLILAQNIVSQLDWDFAKSRFALQYGCVLPRITKARSVMIHQAVNLPVKLAQSASGNAYQTLDLSFQLKINVLTGPNMGGKTTALKTLGQICALAALGIPVPARDAQVCLFDAIWYNHDEAETESLSTFGKEVVALAAVLHKKGRLLLLIDELAKGTNPLEGEAILTAALQYIKQLPCLCLAATHFDKPNTLKGIRRYAIRGIDEKQLQHWDISSSLDISQRLKTINTMMDYSLITIERGALPPRNALSIATLLGLQQEIINSAGLLIK